MAEETQADPVSARAPRASARDGAASSLGEGAAEVAPTAPHATPREGTPKHRTGPEKFWDRRRIRIALTVTSFLSLALHYEMAPWSIFPEHTLSFKDDDDGQLTIPIDMVQEGPETPPPTPLPTPAETAHGEGPKSGPGAHDAGRDAAPRDAGDDARAGEDAGAVARLDDGGAGAGLDGAVAMLDDGGLDAALASSSPDGGPGAGGPRDPSAFLGAAGAVQSGPALVQLLVNMEEIRKNPIGARMGPLLSAIPQWDDFISGTNVDAVRDTDWVLISGPSLLHTERDMIWVHYSASDKLVDHAIDIVAHKYDRGGPFDAGVPGVKASLGHADRAPRVFLRPQSHLLVVVPPDFAHTAAVALVKAHISPHIRPGEALRLTLKNPSHPMPFLPTSLSELRLWIVPRASDGGADVFAEADAPTADEASKASDQVKRLLRDQNSIGVRIVTQGLLNNVEIGPDGSVVKLHLSASREQLEAVLGLVAAQLGVTMPPPAGSATAPR